MFDIFIQCCRLDPMFVRQRREMEICDLFGFLRTRIQRRQIIGNSTDALAQKSSQQVLCLLHRRMDRFGVGADSDESKFGQRAT
ncbi:MAG: hypothetical protein ACREFR_18175 [Limisphaerales bacterium]